MQDTTWILDPVTGALTVEGLSLNAMNQLTAEWLLPGTSLNCARPLAAPALNELTPEAFPATPTLRVQSIYHHSVIEGPGRRSVLQTAGCKHHCPGCYVPETHDPGGGAALTIPAIVAQLLAAEGAPRAGITILGGEPFLQPAGLLALLQALKAHAQHITLYTGYTLEELQQHPAPQIFAILALTDILIDGPFVKALANNAGEWRGSSNQRILSQPAQYFSSPAPNP